jgi:hypothetical protein
MQQSDRDRGLFTAVVSVAAGLELGATLRRLASLGTHAGHPAGAASATTTVG